MLLGKPLFGPGFVPGDLSFNLIGISGVVAEGGPQLGFSEPMVGMAKACKIVVEAFVGGNDLPDVKAGAGNAGSAARRAVSKEEAGTASYLNGFAKQFVGQGREVAAGGVCYHQTAFRAENQGSRELEV